MAFAEERQNVRSDPPRGLMTKVEVHPGAARGETSLRFQWAILETLSLPKGLRPGEAYVSRKDCRDGSGRGT